MICTLARTVRPLGGVNLSSYTKGGRGGEGMCVLQRGGTSNLSHDRGRGRGRGGRLFVAGEDDVSNLKWSLNMPTFSYYYYYSVKKTLLNSGDNISTMGWSRVKVKVSKQLSQQTASVSIIQSNVNRYHGDENQYQNNYLIVIFWEIIVALYT